MPVLIEVPPTHICPLDFPLTSPKLIQSFPTPRKPSFRKTILGSGGFSPFQKSFDTCIVAAESLMNEAKLKKLLRLILPLSSLVNSPALTKFRAMIKPEFAIESKLSPSINPKTPLFSKLLIESL